MKRASIVLLVACLASPALAHKLEGPDGVVLNIDYLLQTQVLGRRAVTPRVDWTTDSFLRRSRILLFGSVTKNITFFMETEQANLGKSGDWAAPFYTQDAFVSFRVADALTVDAGMILLPFSRQNFQGAIGLNGLDYHSGLVKFPDGSHKVWRDSGVQARSYLLDKKLQIRAGVFAGSQSVALQKNPAGAAVVVSNPEDLPRVTGNVRYNLLGTEADYFPKGIYFTKTPIVSVGVGADFQPDAALRTAAVLDTAGAVTTPGVIGSHLGVAADLFVDYPVSATREAIFQGNVFYYDDGDDLATSGFGTAVEAGFRLDKVEPVLGCDYFKSQAAAADLLAVTGGVNYWLKGHNANLKAAATLEKKGDLGAADWTTTIVAQAQLFF